MFMYVEYRENKHPFAMDQWISITDTTERPLLAYSVEKLEKNGGMFFCRKPKHSELRTALGM